jgi:hypothetical protein
MDKYYPESFFRVIDWQDSLSPKIDHSETMPVHRIRKQSVLLFVGTALVAVEQKLTALA